MPSCFWSLRAIVFTNKSLIVFSIESGTGTLIAKCKAFIVLSVFHFSLNMEFWRTVLFNLLTQSSDPPHYHDSIVMLMTTMLLHQTCCHSYPLLLYVYTAFVAASISCSWLLSRSYLPWPHFLLLYSTACTEQRINTLSVSCNKLYINL